MSAANGDRPHILIDPHTRYSEADAACFAKEVAPRLHAVMASLKDEKFIGHTSRSEFPDCTVESPAGTGFAESLLFKHWAEDHKNIMRRRSRMGDVNAEFLLKKYLVMAYEREGGEHISQLAMERAGQINKQERDIQLHHAFLIATAEKVITIKSGWGLAKLFTNAHGKLEDIENSLRAKDVRVSDVMEDPRKCIAENKAALEKINGGNVIEAYEPIHY